MSEKAEELVYGRWPEVLEAAGLDSKFFNGRPGPCPFCGGTDRYQWNHKKGGGIWVCRSCTDGKYASGFQMLMKHMGYLSFIEAANHVRDQLGSVGAPTGDRVVPQYAYKDEWTQERIFANRERMVRFWEEANEVTSIDPVYRYLQNRVPGLDYIPAEIRFHPALEYWAPPVGDGQRPVSLGKFPAMLALARDANGEIVQLHKTFLTQDGHKAAVPIAKKTDYGVGVNSYAVALCNPTKIDGDTIGIAEGIETALASSMMRRVPVWACLSGPVMAKFVLSEYLLKKIRKVIIFADSDELKAAGKHADGRDRLRRPGSFYAEQAAQSLRSQGVRVLVIRSARTGEDFANVWARKQMPSGHSEHSQLGESRSRALA